MCPCPMVPEEEGPRHPHGGVAGDGPAADLSSGSPRFLALDRGGSFVHVDLAAFKRLENV